MTAFGPFPRRRHRNGQFSSVLARSAAAAAPSPPSLPLHPGSRAGVGGTKVFEPRLTNSGMNTFPSYTLLDVTEHLLSTSEAARTLKLGATYVLGN